MQVLEERADRTVSMDRLIMRENLLTELGEPRILLGSFEPKIHAEV